MRNRLSATKPSLQPAGKFVPIPIAHQDAGQLKTVAASPYDITEIGASARKPGLLDAGDCLRRVVGSRAIRVCESSHRVTNDVFQMSLAFLDFGPLCGWRKFGENGM